MRTLLAAIALLSALAANAATLKWDPSPAGSEPVVQYKVESAPVGPPTNAIWSTFGTTPGSVTNLVLANNPYSMFRVKGVTAAGVESDPSNVVTNTQAKPNPPGNAIISAAIESAPSPDGPWTVQASFPTDIQLAGNQFYRTRVNIGNRYE